MNFAALEAQLNRVHDAMLRVTDGSTIDDGSLTFAYHQVEEQGVTAGLRSIVGDDPYFQEYAGAMWRWIGNGGRPLTLDDLLWWMARRAALVGARQTLEELQRYQNEPTFSCTFTVALAKLSTDHPIGRPV